jgi:regulation of enolase protein 1 (concanavalin A-like superfamily)
MVWIGHSSNWEGVEIQFYNYARRCTKMWQRMYMHAYINSASQDSGFLQLFDQCGAMYQGHDTQSYKVP